MRKEALLKDLINKMLKPYGVDYDFIVANPKINNIDWFQYYTFTPETEKAFKDWAIPFIKKRLRCSLAYAGQVYSWFDLCYGLTVITTTEDEIKDKS